MYFAAEFFEAYPIDFDEPGIIGNVDANYPGPVGMAAAAGALAKQGNDRPKEVFVDY